MMYVVIVNRYDRDYASRYGPFDSLDEAYDFVTKALDKWKCDCEVADLLPPTTVKW